MLQRCSTGEAASVQGFCLEAWSSCRLLGLRLEGHKWPGSDFGTSWLTVEYRKIRGLWPCGGQQGRRV